MLTCGMDDGGEIDAIERCDGLRDPVQQGIDVTDFRVCRQNNPQSAQPATLDAHLLPVRKRYLVMQIADHKTEVVAQVPVQFQTAQLAGWHATGHDLTLGDLHPYRTAAGGTGIQNGLLERTGMLLHSLQLLAEYRFIHARPNQDFP